MEAERLTGGARRCSLFVWAACLAFACSDSRPVDDVELAAAGASGGSNMSGDDDGSGAGSSDGDGSGSSDGDGSDSGSRGDSTAPGTPPTFVPSFPGAGTSDAGEPLMNGELCDYVPGDGDVPTADEVTTCFFGMDGNPVPAATLEQVLECVEGDDVVHIRLTFNPGFVDNSYGTGSVGWPSPVRGHWFFDLLGSDHAEMLIQDGNGDVVLQFKLDYISDDSSAPSGFASAGVTGGDGALILGEADWILDYSTSLDRNLNERGYGEYTVDSPHTDESYSPNPDTPGWDYRVVYEAWIDVAALGDNGFGGAFIEFVHASPSKDERETIEVMPGECPPDFCEDPDGCYSDPPPDECGDTPDEDCGDPPPPPDEEECGDAPDEDCGDGEVPPPGSPEYCEAFPDDPVCNVD